MREARCLDLAIQGAVNDIEAAVCKCIRIIIQNEPYVLMK